MQADKTAQRAPYARSAGTSGTYHARSDQRSEAMLEQVAARFRLLGEPVRLKLLAALEDGDRNVGELAALTHTGQANVSKHLAALAQAGIIRRRKVGTSTYYALADGSTFTLCDIVCAGLQEHMAAQARELGLDPAGGAEAPSNGAPGSLTRPSEA